jgi:hypothetical protein
MYPNNQAIEIFGEQVQWPGVDPETGKFTNGSFDNPIVKPSFIPAETLNLILDNLSALISKCGGAPNAVTGSQLADLVTSLAVANKIVMRDAQGRARVAAPLDKADIARLADIQESAKHITPDGFGLYQPGRDLMAVLGVSAIPAAMAALRERCNGTGTPDFSGLQIGDYLDGLDLSAIPAENGGTAGQAWNAGYQNNRVVLSGFNTYKQSGDTEVTKNHLLFTFRNIPLRKRMNPTDSNIGGYAASEIRAFLEGANGDGTGDYAGATAVTTGAFLNALKAQIGDYILPVRRLLSIRPSSGVAWAWLTCSLFLPSEHEIFGASGRGDPSYDDGLKVQFPIYQKASTYRCKRYNGARDLHWECSPYSGSAAIFYGVHNNGNAHIYIASAVGGCTPALCIA